MKKILMRTLIAATVISIVGCGIKHMNTDPDSPGGFGIKGLHQMGKGFHFMASLNLTSEQKQSLKSLKKEGWALKHDDNSKQTKEAVKNTLKTEFVKDSLSRDDLKEKLAQYKPELDRKMNQIAALVVKGYKILTPEQREKIKSKMDEMRDKMQAGGFKKMEARMLNKLSKNLDLSQEQIERIKAEIEAQRPDMDTLKTKHAEARAAIEAELNTDAPSSEKLVEIFKNAHLNERMDKGLTHLVTLHGILTPEQRQSFVESGFFKRGFGHHRGHRRGPGHHFF